MNKIKVIGLLNMISKGEEVPKKILLNGIIFEYQGDDYLYKDEDKKEHWLFSEGYTNKYMWLENFLKAEAEIIEESKKIEKEDLFKLDESMSKASLVAWQKANNGILKKKIDELIDEINNLKEK